MSAIPDFQSIMLPMLQILSDGKERTLQDVIMLISDKFMLTPEERKIPLTTSNQPIISNRVSWARTYLTKADLIQVPNRGIMKITTDGMEILKTKPPRIDIKLLKRLPAFQKWRESYRTRPNEDILEKSIEETEAVVSPVELLEYSYNKIHSELAIELLEKIKSSTPTFFEKLVVDLLIKMGYGGSRSESGQIVGQSGDGGIDGIIKEDKLGLDVIYIQAKKWESPVTIHSVRDFAGALMSKKARKGIFITSSSFPESARKFVNDIDHKIVLIDGKELATLMIENNVGVSIKDIYEVKRLDTDYFEEV